MSIFFINNSDVSWRKTIRAGSALFLFLFFAGCATENLISEDRQQEWASPESTITIQQLQQAVLRQIDPSERYRPGANMHVTAVDRWNATLIRLMTPLDRDNQRFEARLGLYHQGIEFTFLNGEKMGQTIGFDGQSYAYVATEKHYQERAGTALYLDPLQGYLEWSQTLIRKPALTLMGTRNINNTPYWVVYTTAEPLEKLDQNNQYLIYINKQNNRIDYVEFTLRELMKSYRGVIHYKNYEMVQGVLMPFWIGIADDLLQPDFDHYLIVESITIRPPQPFS